jgi:tetratricopeptide (TPR) repeat protein
MNESSRRLIGYPLAAMVAGGLVLCGLYEAEADYGTLIGSATVHAELAMAIPADTKNVTARDLRVRLLEQASDWLARADAAEPAAALTDEVAAFIATARGDHALAALRYGRAAGRPDCTDAQRITMRLNQARALSNVGGFEQALAALGQLPRQLPPEVSRSARRLEARLLARAGRFADALRAARQVAGQSPSAPAEIVETAALFEELGDATAAESLYRQIPDDMASVNYYLARLKLRAGRIDSAMELLERAVTISRPKVHGFLQRDRAAWDVCSGSERFRSLSEPDGNAAPMGR